MIDRHLVHGELTIRHHLGLYAGAIGTASAVMLHSSAQERQRGSMRGAVVAGLGKYDGSLTVGKLSEALRTACLRYLIHVLDSGAVAAGTEKAQGVKLGNPNLGPAAAMGHAANRAAADAFAERITLRLHLGICDACTRLTSQVAFLRRALNAFPGPDDPEGR